MEAKSTTRLILLGALLLPGCQLKIDPSIFPTIAPTTAVTSVPTSRPTFGPSMPPATPSPRPSFDPAACERNDPAATPSTGDARHGTYNAQRLPNGFDALSSEEAVTDAIARVEGNGSDWACFQKFFPGATKVFMIKRDGRPRPNETAMPTSPRPTTMIGIWEPPPPPCRPVSAGTVAINGMVFDQQGVPFATGVEVRVRNPNHSFSQDAIVENGHYYVYGAPAGEKLEITAVVQDSGEARRRFVVPQAYYQDCGNEGFSVVNFGGPKSAEDAVGHRYPLVGDAQTQVKNQTTLVSGQVFDIWGGQLDGVTIVATSLDADAPYKATATTSNGAWVMNNVPAGVPVEFRCEYPNYRARARVGVFFAGGKRNVLNFGGDPTIEDPQGPQYGLALLPPETYRKPVVITGKVRDIDGKVVRTGKITIVSLAPEVPFSATISLLDGQYVVNNLPAGIEFEFMLEASGFEPTWRYERVRAGGGEINFGEGGDGDPEGEYYGLVEEVEDDEESEG